MLKFYVAEDRLTRQGWKQEVSAYFARNREELERDLTHDAMTSPLAFKWMILGEEAHARGKGKEVCV